MARHSEAEDTDVLALEALAFLAESAEDLALFMRISGVDPAGLRAQAGEPQFLGGVLDYLLANEDLLTRFCRKCEVEPAAVHRLRARLSEQSPGHSA